MKSQKHYMIFQILLNLRREHPITQLDQAVDGSDLLDLQKRVWDVHVDETLQEYVVALVTATRSHPDLALGVSPRGSLALFKAAQALAAVRGRPFVAPDDVKYLTRPVLVHRVIPRAESHLRGHTAEQALQEVLESVAVPVEEEAGAGER